jgi:beta-lactam-binding protein with PASTA domain
MLKTWIFNIGLAIVAFLLFVWLTFGFMNWYTNHGENIDVPNLKGVSVNTAMSQLEEKGLRWEIIDSVYSEDFKKNAITEHDPGGGSKVKSNRIIYLTVNALGKPKIKMPKLVDQSFTLAKALLKTMGLELGTVMYTYDEIGHNLVMEQKMGGIEVPPGKLILKGSTIDLVVATNRKSVAPDDSTAHEYIDHDLIDGEPVKDLEKAPEPGF